MTTRTETGGERTTRLPGIAGRRALVTGGSRGIGRAVVTLLAGQGAGVGFCYRSAREAADEALAEARRAGPDGEHWHVAADLARAEDVERLYGRMDEAFGGLDLFVGNAGIWNEEDRPLEELESEEWERMLEVNLTSVYRTTRAAVRRMGEGGRIVLVGSTAGQRGEPGHSHYAATKGGIASFAKSLAGELGPRGITVNTVAPGWVDTEMSAAVLRSEEREAALEEIPLGRVATAGDVAGPICFLLSDLARHVTGEVLNVNGGSVLCG